MTLSFSSLRSRSLGRDKAASLSKEGPRSTKRAYREGHAADDVVDAGNGDDAKLSPPPPPSTTESARGNTKIEEQPATTDDDVIPLIRAHVSKYATRDNWRGAQVSLVTTVYFVLTALAPWLLTARLSAAAAALGLSPAARSASTVLLWAAWAILRAAAYVRSFMLVRELFCWLVGGREMERTRAARERARERERERAEK